MGVWKCTASYQQQASDRLAGWTESWWHADGNVSDMIANLEELNSLAAPLRGDDCRATFFKLAEYDLTLGKYTRATLIQNGPASPIGTGGDSDYPTVGLSYVMNNKTGGGPNTLGYDYRAFGMIRGLADPMVIQGGGGGPNLTDAFNAFRDKLVEKPWGLVVQSKLSLTKSIQSVSNVGVVQSAAHGLATGDKISVHKVQGIPSANGRWTVTKLSDDTFSLNGFSAMPTGAVGYGATMYWRKPTYLFVDITRAALWRISSRKAGRPSVLFTGRRQ